VISDYISRLALGLPLVDFYREVFPTDEMKTIVASMYVEVVEFLDRATSYYCLGSLSEYLPLPPCIGCVSEGLKGKLVDALVQPVVYKLETYINNIEASKRRILELKDAAHIAQQADMKFTLENTSAGASSPGP
jgi:hypothetical protein